MSTLKQQIQVDLEVLKTLDLEVIPAKTFYGESLKFFLMLWTGFLGIQFMAAEVAIKMGAWQDYLAEHVNEAYRIIAKMWLGCIVSSLIISFIFLSFAKFYIVFKHQIREHLQTGNLISRKICHMAGVFYGFFALLIFPFTLCLNPDLTLFSAVFAYIFAGLISQFLIKMELTRAGVAVLLKAISVLTSPS